MIYESIPEKHKINISEQQLSELIYYLWIHRGTYIKSNEIARATGFNNKGSCVELRNAITILIEEKELPIIADNNGYCYATDTEMIRKYVQTLIGRVQGINKRINALTIMVNKAENHIL